MNEIYSTLGLVVGLSFLTVGLICMILKTSGHTTMHVILWGFNIRIMTSIPGVIYATLGLLVIFVTRPA